MKHFKSSVIDHTVLFSVKFQNFKKNILKLEINDFFLFFWNERECWAEILLKIYSAENLSNNNVLAIETNISSYNMINNDETALF